MTPAEMMHAVVTGNLGVFTPNHINPLVAAKAVPRVELTIALSQVSNGFVLRLHHPRHTDTAITYVAMDLLGVTDIITAHLVALKLGEQS